MRKREPVRSSAQARPTIVPTWHSSPTCSNLSDSGKAATSAFASAVMPDCSSSLVTATMMRERLINYKTVGSRERPVNYHLHQCRQMAKTDYAAGCQPITSSQFYGLPFTPFSNRSFRALGLRPGFLLRQRGLAAPSGDRSEW